MRKGVQILLVTFTKLFFKIQVPDPLIYFGHLVIAPNLKPRNVNPAYYGEPSLTVPALSFKLSNMNGLISTNIC